MADGPSASENLMQKLHTYEIASMFVYSLSNSANENSYKRSHSRTNQSVSESVFWVSDSLIKMITCFVLECIIVFEQIDCFLVLFIVISIITVLINIWSHFILRSNSRY